MKIMLIQNGLIKYFEKNLSTLLIVVPVYDIAELPNGCKSMQGKHITIESNSLTEQTILYIDRNTNLFEYLGDGNLIFKMHQLYFQILIIVMKDQQHMQTALIEDRANIGEIPPSNVCRDLDALE